MKRPAVLFFDLVETVADISTVPQQDLRDYASKFVAVADGREDFSLIEFGAGWDRCEISESIVWSLKTLQTIASCCVLTNAPLPFAIAVSNRSAVKWDAVLTGDMFQQYKPDPSVYYGALSLLRIAPEQGMMVAAHRFDVVAARGIGMQGWEIGNKNKGADGGWDDLIEHIRRQVA
jgi:2-haloacid dehalogenase